MAAAHLRASPTATSASRLVMIHLRCFVDFDCLFADMTFSLFEWIEYISESLSSTIPTGPYYVPVVLYERIGSLYEALHNSIKSFVLLPPYEASLSEWIPNWLSRLPMGSVGTDSPVTALCLTCLFSSTSDGPESIAGTASKSYLDSGSLSWSEYFSRDPVCMSLLSTFIISIVPIVILAPALRLKPASSSRDNTLHYLLAFAAGGLLGDVFFHLLPEAFGRPAVFLLTIFSHSHSHSDGGDGHHEDEHFLLYYYKQIGLALVIGIVLFWFFELLSGDAEACSHPMPLPSTLSEEPTKARVKKRASNRVSRKAAGTVARTVEAPSSSMDWVHLDEGDSGQEIEEPGPRKKQGSRKSKAAAVATVEAHSVSSTSLPSAFEAQPSRKVAPSAWLHLMADALHNFTDGLALSAAWIASLSGHATSGHGHEHAVALGWSTTLAILFHEVPHELGDIAILMKVGGMTLRSALWAQCFTALGAFAGTLTGLWLGLYAGSYWSSSTHLFALVLPFTAGGFLYLALSMTLPQIKESRAQDVSRPKSTLFVTLACFTIGLALMYCAN